MRRGVAGRDKGIFKRYVEKNRAEKMQGCVESWFKYLSRKITPKLLEFSWKNSVPPPCSSGTYN